MSLDFPLLVRSRNFCFFFCLGGGKGAVFLLCFYPLSREGNSGLHSTPSNYSSFYGSGGEKKDSPKPVERKEEGRKVSALLPPLLNR